MTTNSLLGVELENGGVLMKFVQTSAETNGALHAQEARYPPRSQPAPIHCHPRQDERFVILEGALEFLVGGEERTVSAGAELAVPHGVYHRAYNARDAPALVLWETRPALRTAEFFVAMNRASRGRPRPRFADAAAVLNEYRDEFVLQKPPRIVQRIVFACLAPFART